MQIFLNAPELRWGRCEDVVGVHVTGQDSVASDSVFAKVYGHAFSQFGICHAQSEGYHQENGSDRNDRAFSFAPRYCQELWMGFRPNG